MVFCDWLLSPSMDSGGTQEGLQEEVAFDSGPWGMNFYIWSQMFVAGKESLD